MIRSALQVPVLIAFDEAAARQDSWGRVAELSALEAVLETRSPLRRGERLALSFDLAGRIFKELPAVVSFVEVDVDGYTRAGARFADEVEKRRLAAALLDILSRS